MKLHALAKKERIPNHIQKIFDKIEKPSLHKMVNKAQAGLIEFKSKLMKRSGTLDASAAQAKGHKHNTAASRARMNALVNKQRVKSEAEWRHKKKKLYEAKGKFQEAKKRLTTEINNCNREKKNIRAQIARQEHECRKMRKHNKQYQDCWRKVEPARREERKLHSQCQRVHNEYRKHFG